MRVISFCVSHMPPLLSRARPRSLFNEFLPLGKPPSHYSRPQVRCYLPTSSGCLSGVPEGRAVLTLSPLGSLNAGSLLSPTLYFLAPGMGLWDASQRFPQGIWDAEQAPGGHSHLLSAPSVSQSARGEKCCFCCLGLFSACTSQTFLGPRAVTAAFPLW